MTPQMSAYLDLLRALAALAVLFGHLDQDGLYWSWFPLAKLSHEAVIVFFVLSGYIIAGTTLAGQRSAFDYAISRLSRVYSVALPAVLFSVAVAILASHRLPDLTGRMSNFSEPTLGAVIRSLLFLNESWLSSGELTMNNPYWSLCYEVWYYVLFGIAYFARSARRVGLLILAAILAGPSVLALAPVWILGALMAAYPSMIPSWSRRKAALVYVLTLFVIVAIPASGMDVTIRRVLHDSIPGFWRLNSSQRLVTDYLLGVCVAAHLIAFRSLGDLMPNLICRARPSYTWIAGFSFTLYLFHRPMTQVWGAWNPNTEQSLAASVLAAAVVIAACYGISLLTEGQLPRIRQTLRRLTEGSSKRTWIRGR